MSVLTRPSVPAAQETADEALANATPVSCAIRVQGITGVVFRVICGAGMGGLLGAHEARAAPGWDAAGALFLLREYLF